MFEELNAEVYLIINLFYKLRKVNDMIRIED